MKYTRIQIALIAFAILAIITFVSVLAAGFVEGWGFPNAYKLCDTPTQGVLAGFVHGMWDGIIFPVSVIAMFFRDDIAPISVMNNGVEYWLGFGIVMYNWGSSSSSYRKSE